MSVLKVGVIHISFQGSLNMTCDYMKVTSQGFASSPIAIHIPGLYLAGYASMPSARCCKPTCQVPLQYVFIVFTTLYINIISTFVRTIY